MIIPHSLRDYIYQGGIRRAINELLELGDEGILDGLEWAELGRFYRAQMAAHQFESEWAIFAVEAWSEIWGGMLDHWEAWSPDEQMEDRDDCGVSLSDLTNAQDDSLWFGRVFSKDSWTFYASLLALPQKGLVVETACVKGNQSISFLEFAAKQHETGNWRAGNVLSLDADSADLGELRELASRAVSTADREVASKRARSKARPEN